MKSRTTTKPPFGIRIERLGVFGGTFDPIHNGHLICAEQVREAVGLDLVLFMPCRKPPHKPRFRPASAAHRLAMVELAVEGHRGFAVSDLEIKRPGVSYTVDTVRRLRRAFGAGVQYWLLMGMDTYLDVASWKSPHELAADCFFAVARRPGYRKRLAPPVPRAKTAFVDITPVDVSSTDIRTRLAEGRSISFLVPKAVERYIWVEGPYASAGRAGRPRTHGRVD